MAIFFAKKFGVICTKTEIIAQNVLLQFEDSFRHGRIQGGGRWGSAPTWTCKRGGDVGPPSKSQGYHIFQI